MTSPDEAFRAALRAAPTADPGRLAKQHGLSGRAARRLVRELEREGVLRSRRGVRLAVLAVVVAGGAWIVWRALAPDPARAPPASSVDTRRPVAAVQERDLYQAIDARDPGRIAAAAGQLTSEDEPLRLAALRYLVAVGATECQDAILARLDDPSERLRLAAIQLVARLPGATVDERLAAVFVDPRRPLGERTVAAASLGQRKVEAPGRLASRPLARQLLPALQDASLPIRDETARLLT